MKFNLFCTLLLLYPADFRKQFAGEMISVFEQSANTHENSMGFFLAEFASILKGAFIMWLSKFFAIKRKPSPSSFVATETLTIAELEKQRGAAIESMVAAIADHDFVNARLYSNQEIRLKTLLQKQSREAVLARCNPS